MDLIVGAGISGLSYAAFTDNDYLIIEQDSEIGGYCKTIKQDGFVWDYSGHFFHFQNKDIKDFIFENLSEKEILSIIKATQIFYKGHLIDYPFQKNIHQLPKEEFIDCLYDLFCNDNKDETTFKQMLYAKFGKSIAEKFLIPYNEKLYACDLNKLDVDAMGRFFPYADKEDIISNFRKQKEGSYNAAFVYPKGGAIEYILSVCSHIQMDKIHFNEKLESIDIKDHIAYTTKREIKYDNLISTIPFPLLLKNTGIKFDPDLYSSNKVLVFNLGFDLPDTNNHNHWIYYSDKNLPFYRIGFYNNIFGSDRLSVYVEIGFKENDDVNVQTSLENVLNSMRRIGIIKQHKLISQHHVIMDPAYVHVTKNMEQDRAHKMAELQALDIYSIGRYGAWKYCSIEDNITDAKKLSEHIR